MKQYLDNTSFFTFEKFDQMKVDLQELILYVTVTNVNFSDYGIFHLDK